MLLSRLVKRQSKKIPLKSKADLIEEIQDKYFSLASQTPGAPGTKSLFAEMDAKIEAIAAGTDYLGSNNFYAKESWWSSFAKH